jgi:hypothetical protein
MWSGSNSRAGDRGGAVAGKPRWGLGDHGGCSMAAMIVNMPPLEAVSISNTRLSKRAQRMRVGAEGGDASA